MSTGAREVVENEREDFPDRAHGARLSRCRALRGQGRREDGSVLGCGWSAHACRNVALKKEII